jgi:hypothetical protein
MAVYTCYDMIRDCQAGRAEGWVYLAESFAPALSALAQHYGGDAKTVETLLLRLKQGAEPLASMAACHQRECLYQLRPLILEAAGAKADPGADLEAVTTALQPLTATERQAAWLETFGYDVPQTAVLMRMAPETVAALRARTEELLRGGMDSWRAGMMAREGAALGRAMEALAAGAEPAVEPLEFRHFLDVIDGRITWQRRTGFERQLEASWPEVHKACRIREADHALAPNTAFDAGPYLTLLGVARPKPPLWKTLLSRA